MRKYLLVALILPFLLVGCTRRENAALLRSWVTKAESFNPEKYKKVALLHTKTEHVSNALLIWFLRNGVEVVEREHINDLLLEQHLSREGYQDLSDAEKARRLGRILHADAIFLLYPQEQSYPRYVKGNPVPDTMARREIRIACKVVDTTLGEVVFMGTAELSATGKIFNSPLAQKILAYREIYHAIYDPQYEPKNEAYCGEQIQDYLLQGKKNKDFKWTEYQWEQVK